MKMRPARSMKDLALFSTKDEALVQAAFTMRYQRRSNPGTPGMAASLIEGDNGFRICLSPNTDRDLKEVRRQVSAAELTVSAVWGEQVLLEAYPERKSK